MFRTPVSVYMTLEPATVPKTASLESVAAELERRRISAMPVLDERRHAVGVISRRDLLRVGKLEVPKDRAVPIWSLPDQTAGDVMTEHPLSVAPSTSLREAAALMLDNHRHRVFVEVDHELRGVLTTRDVMQAIVDVRLEAPIERFLSERVQTIATFEPLAAARRQLEELKVRGLVVSEEGIPVGIFAEEDALASRHRDANTAVDQVMGHEVLIERPEAPAFRVAGRMASMHARRVVAMRDGDLVGILTEFDLAGAAAITD